MCRSCSEGPTTPAYRPLARLNSPFAAPPLSALLVSLSSSSTSLARCGVFSADASRGRAAFSGEMLPAANLTPRVPVSSPLALCWLEEGAPPSRDALLATSSVDLLSWLDDVLWLPVISRLRETRPGIGLTSSLSSGTSVCPVRTL